VKQNIDRSKNPYPIHLSEDLWTRIEGIKKALLDLPKFSEIVRAALTLGLAQLEAMPQEELAKKVRGF